MLSSILRYAGALLFGLSAHAQAIQLSISPISQDVPVGSLVSAQIVISELGSGAGPSLGAFDIDIGFNPSVLSFATVTFGDQTLGNQLDLFGLGSITSGTPSAGSVNLFQLSLDSAADLDALQAPSFALGTIQFSANGLGTSTLTIHPNSLSDSTGNVLTATVLDGAISVHAVPEPANVTLLVAGLAMMVVVSIRRRSV
jgi:hypothetical protein